MWYHATGKYGDRQRHWWNRRRDHLISDVLVPFVGRQVRLASREGIPSLFNFGALSYLTILSTEERLVPARNRRTPKELENPHFIERHNVTDRFAKDIVVLSSSTAARSLIERALRPTVKQIFVIMKFGDQLVDSAYEGVIEPLGREFGYDVVRADRIQDSGNISHEILENIAQSRLVIADLTGERPNCYYEAGFAHALGREIVFAVKGTDPVHFDLAGYRFIQWSTESEYRRKLKARLQSLESRASD